MCASSWGVLCGPVDGNEDVLPPLDLSLPSRLQHQVHELRQGALSVLHSLAALPEATVAFVQGACPRHRLPSLGAVVPA